MAGSDGRTGQGVTLTFGTSGFTASLHSVTGTERTREPVEDSHLGLASGSEMTFVPNDLIDGGEFTFRYEWNQSFGTFPPITGAAETVTVTFPLRSGETTNATLAGTGFMTRDKGADIELNSASVMEGEGTIKWDGKTGPTYTAGS